jgi:hypothetical protein
MDAPNMTQQVPERQRKRKLPQVSLQDNFNPVGLIKSQETLTIVTGHIEAYSVTFMLKLTGMLKV